MSTNNGTKAKAKFWGLCFGLGIFIGITTFFQKNAIAQVVPDNTLPTNSRVTNQGNTNLIEGGTQAGGNLFHSFQQFSILNNNTAFFNNSFDIRNIISRVTGGSISNIDGLIRANGTANLFLINPSGIVFGPNARLDVGGSFFGSTASSLRFADGTFFSATNTQSNPLLTISVPIGLQFGANPGQIAVQGDGLGQRLTSELIDTTNALRVPSNQTLALVGGDIDLEGATLKTAGGRIELGSVAGEGLVTLTPVSKGFSLGYNGVQNFGNIQLLQQAIADASGEGGGDVQVTGRRISLKNGSQIETSTLGALAGGNLVINAQELVEVIGSNDSQRSGLFANVYREATANGPNLIINTNDLLVQDGALLTTTTFGGGNAGNLTINAKQGVSFDNGDAFSRVGSQEAVGDGGNISITTGELSLTNDAGLTASTSGQGNAGSIIIDAKQRVAFDNSTASSTVEEGAVGDGGNISITADELSLTNDARLTASTSGQGNAGSIIIDAKGRATFDNGDIVNTVNTGAVGDGGNISITAGELSLTNDALLDTSTSGEGNGGDIFITTGELSLTSGALLDAGTFDQGNAGNIIIDAKGVAFDNSTASSTVEAFAVGDGGNISITAGELSLTNDARLTASTNGEGNGGDISITTGELSLTNDARLTASTFGEGNAGSIIIDAKGRATFDNGDIVSTVNTGAVGDGGNISITAGELSLTNDALLDTSTSGEGNGGDISITTGELSLTSGALLDAGTFDQGNAGNIIIDAKGVAFDNSTASSTVEAFAVGDGGNISITAGELSLTNDARLTASTFGEGNAGSIIIDAKGRVAFDNGDILSTVNTGALGNGGNISITAGELSLTNDALLDTSTSGEGNGGDIFITTGELSLTSGALLDAGTFDQGNAGNIIIDAKGVAFDNSTASSTVEAFAVGDGGNISITAGELSLTNDARLTASTNGEGNGGDISITTGELSLTNDARLTASTFGEGNAGSIIIDAKGRATFDNGDIVSTVNTGAVGDGGNISITAGELSLTNDALLDTSTSGEGNGGDISITTGELSLTSGALLDAGTFDQGNAGNIIIDAKGVAFDNSTAFSTVEAGAVGDGGNISITAGELSLTNDARLTASTFGEGNAGSIIIDAKGRVAFDNGDIFSTVEEGAVGDGGNISITAGELSLTNDAGLTASTSGQGNAGSIIIDAKGRVAFDNNSTAFSTVNAGAVGDAGNVEIQAGSLSLTEGAGILTQTLGTGNAGFIRINATDKVEISGVAPFPTLPDGRTGGFSSGLLTNTEKGAVGEGNDITITTNTLSLANGGVLSARSMSDFRGGNVRVNANHLEITGGGQILTTAFSGGNAGNININVRDSLSISGADPTLLDRINQLTQAFDAETARFIIDPVDPNSGLFANTAPGSTGNGGSIFIDPPKVTLKDGGRISVNSQGSGDAGAIQLLAGKLTLDNGASISGKTVTGRGGNIDLKLGDLLLLRRNSSITTTAQVDGNGGSININTPFIVTLPNENSDITANAFTGVGGRVNINATGIFGIEPRSRNDLVNRLGTNDPTQLDPQRLGTNDITAISQDNPSLEGQVSITTPDVDPSQGISEFPVNLINISNLTDSSCVAFGANNPNQFIVTGRGGLPPSPNDPLTPDALWTDERLVKIPNQDFKPQKKRESSKKSTTPSPELKPATGWVFNQKGEVTLISHNDNATPYGFGNPMSGCRL